jgi:hypothetical protein
MGVGPSEVLVFLLAVVELVQKGPVCMVQDSIHPSWPGSWVQWQSVLILKSSSPR